MEMAHVGFYLICEVFEYRGRNVFSGGGEASRVLVELELTHECEMITGGIGFNQLYLLEAQAPTICQLFGIPDRFHRCLPLIFRTP